MILLNGKQYDDPIIDFNALVKMRARGYNLETGANEPIKAIYYILSLCVGSVKRARKEVKAHIQKGGRIDDLARECSRIIEQSPLMKDGESNVGNDR